MLIVSSEKLDRWEERYPGVRESVLAYEAEHLPACPQCQSGETAKVIYGIIGRTMAIAGSTNKVHLLPNSPGPGRYFCNACRSYFDVLSEAQ